ncbi:MAG: CPBP family intramembrane metalloprotease [Planctomycetota bacterium]|nr:CPBP family intramembrane metalloprotease [Planctomycetota bacterium]
MPEPHEAEAPPPDAGEPPMPPPHPFQGRKRALLLLGAGFLLFQLALVLSVPASDAPPPLVEPPPAPAAVEQEIDVERLLNDLSAGAPHALILAAFAALNVLGMLAAWAGFSGWLLAPDLRARLALGRFADRAQPRVSALDLGAVVLLVFTARILFLHALARCTPAAWWEAVPGGWMPVGGAGLVASLAAQFLGYAVALAGLVWAVRERDPERAAAGIWPFWSNRTVAPPSNPAADVRLGLAAYFLLSWLLLAINAASQAFFKRFGMTPDENPVLDILRDETSASGSWLTVGLLVLAASLGAAVFEELLFRGLLYNVARRYLGPLPGALVAAFAFAGIHFVWSNFAALFVMALALTWLYERTGRLLAPIVLHFVNNLLALVVTIALAHRG